MLMDIPKLRHLADPVKNLFHPVAAVDGLQCGRKGGLNANFKLELAGTGFPQQGDILVLEQIGGKLKMKVGHPVVPLYQIAPDRAVVGRTAVKGTVYKFDLRHPMGEK